MLGPTQEQDEKAYFFVTAPLASANAGCSLYATVGSSAARPCWSRERAKDPAARDTKRLAEPKNHNQKHEAPRARTHPTAAASATSAAKSAASGSAPASMPPGGAGSFCGGSSGGSRSPRRSRNSAATQLLHFENLCSCQSVVVVASNSLEKEIRLDTVTLTFCMDNCVGCQRRRANEDQHLCAAPARD